MTSSVTATGDIAPRAPVDAAIADVIAGVHAGVQVHASVDGDVIADFGVGEARPGVAMTPETPVPWLSATKPLLALAVGQLHSEGRLRFDDRVADHVPAFAAENKGDVRISHLLTHTVPFARDVTMMSLDSWETAIADACALPLRKGGHVGREVRYTAIASWQILGEIVQRLTGSPVAQHVRRTIMEPLGMTSSRLRGDSDPVTAIAAPPLSQLEDRRSGASGVFELSYAALRPDVAVPGVGGTGPMRDLGRLYAALVARRDLIERIGVDQDVADQMTRSHRLRLHDSFYGAPVEWGLGFITDRRVLAGTRVSRGTFGHDGRLCAVAFGDPERKIAVCVMANALVDPRLNNRRLRHVIDAVLDEAGLPRWRARVATTTAMPLP